MNDDTFEEHTKRYEGVLSILTKIDVRIRRGRTTPKLFDQRRFIPRLIEYHEVIEVEGKIVIHVRLSLQDLYHLIPKMVAASQTTFVYHTVDREAFDYDTLVVFTLVEEDGELKAVDIKDFLDPGPELADQKTTRELCGCSYCKVTCNSDSRIPGGDDARD